MGASLSDTFTCAREVFQAVDDALGQHLSRLMREGPEDQLTLTENAQPALMAVSLAVARTLEEEFNIGVDGVAFVPEGFQMPADRDNFSSMMDTIDEGYFPTMGISILHGRGFLASDTAEAPPKINDMRRR